MEYKADKADIPDILAAYIDERSIDPELVRFGVEGSLSEPSESAVGVSFDEFRQLSTAKVKALFAEKGMDGHIVWTKETVSDELKRGRIDVLLCKNPFPVSNPEIADGYSVCWEQERFGAGLGLPDVLFSFEQNAPITFGVDDGNGGVVNEKFCSCNISAKAANAEEEAELMAAALNYVQLSPYFALLYFDFLGYSSRPTEIVKGDANCDTLADMADVVLVMQSLSKPDKYGENGTAEGHMTAQGKENADMNGDGLTVGDAQAIQEMLLGLD